MSDSSPRMPSDPIHDGSQEAAGGACEALHAGSLWARLRYTPLSDVLRGKLTCRLSVRGAIVPLQLPAPLDQLAEQVARDTRLWRSEQVDVARELAGHFRDGIETGASAEQLAARFGDPRQVARMIRRARIRCRPWTWHVFRWSARLAGVFFLSCVLVYLALTARYLWSAPTISRDFVAEMNAAAKSVPEDERAWPLYRESLLALEPAEDQRDWWSGVNLQIFPEDPAWNDVLEYLKANQQPLDLVRRGATRPRLGYIYGDPENRPLRRGQSDLPSPDDSLLSLNLQFVVELNRLMRLVVADLIRATQTGDSDAAAADVRTLLAVAEQMRDTEIQFAEIVSLNNFRAALGRTADVLHEKPDLLSDSQWIEVAHRISAYAGGGALRPQSESELRLIEDILQRTFTDDGSGDGYLTGKGAEMLQEFDGYHSPHGDGLPQILGAALWTAAGPVRAGLVASREEQLELARHLVDLAEEDWSGPIGTWGTSRYSAEVERIKSSPRDRLRYAPILLLLSPQQNAAILAERITQERDAVLVAIALELYRRQSGDWPKELRELVPRYLPELPLDRFTGATLTYRLRDEKPLLYSLGVDRQDDAGRQPTGIDARREFEAHVLGAPLDPLPAPGGGFDWVLYPPERQSPPEDR